MKKTAPFPEILRQLANEHLEREVNAYIERLEAVVKAANVVISDKKFESISGAEGLKSALTDLEH